jgi:hypothetical protein
VDQTSISTQASRDGVGAFAASIAAAEIQEEYFYLTR